MDNLLMSLINRFRARLLAGNAHQSPVVCRLSLSVATACAALSVLLAAVPASAITYDAAADYSTVNNPNGVWSAGFKTALTGVLDLYELNDL